MVVWSIIYISYASLQLNSLLGNTLISVPLIATQGNILKSRLVIDSASELHLLSPAFSSPAPVFGENLSITGQDPSVSTSNRLHVEISRFFSLI